MTKLITCLTILFALLAGALFFGSGIFTSQVMADTPDAGPTICRQVQVPLDEGYGISRMVTRTRCRTGL